MTGKQETSCPLKKVCSQCGKEFPATLEFFHKDSCSKYGLHSWCEKCFLEKSNKASRKWKAANKERVKHTHREWVHARGGSAKYRRELYSDRLTALDELKDSPCNDCGKKFPPVAMDFDHVQGEKTRTISYLVRNSTWEAVLEEIAKCELVCANCHRVRTSKRGESRNLAYREEVV